jgi:hypothetical protein
MYGEHKAKTSFVSIEIKCVGLTLEVNGSDSGSGTNILNAELSDFLRSSRQMLGYYLEIGHNYFVIFKRLPYIITLPSHSLKTTSATDSAVYFP